MEQPVRVRFDTPLAPEMAWAFGLFARDHGVAWQTVEAGEEVLISEDPGADVVLSTTFRERFEAGDLDAGDLFPDAPVLHAGNGRPDPLSTAFYHVNGLQEHDTDAADRYGRFPFEASLQARFGIAERNLIGELFADLQVALGVGHPATARSRLWVSHDIDLIHHAWKEEGKAALRRGRVDRFLAGAAREAVGRPDWANVEDLIELDRAHGFPATFFWLPRYSDRSADPPDADYRMDEPVVQTMYGAVEAADAYENGLHRSAHGRIDEEAAMLPAPVRANRNHFLRIRLPDHWEAVARAGLALDSSLAWAESPGFRNSYGRAFRPWSLSDRQAYRFLEMPFHLMDTTFAHYRGTGAADAVRTGSLFLEAHRTGCDIGLLWHNNAIGPRDSTGFAEAYSTLLKRAAELGFQPASVADLLANG